MANKTPKGKGKEAYYARYALNKTQAVNRKRKLEKLLKEQPNNLQIQAALKDIKYRRSTPKVSHWSHSMIKDASLIKKFVGKFDKNVFSADPKVHAAAIRVRNENIFSNYKTPDFNKNSMFSLKERAHTKNGLNAWM